MRLLRVSVSAVALGLLSACGAGDQPPAPVVEASPLPPAALLAAAPTVTPEPGGASAVLLAHTTVKAACRVYYGRSPEAVDGWASDTDMSAGPHTTHKAVMLGLQPATTYYYRFVGTDATGRSYAGTGGTFRTDPAPRLPPGRNLAPAAGVSAVSSQYSDAYAAANAIDDNSSTEWATKGDGDHASITIDLGRTYDITGVGFRPRQMSDGTSIITAVEIVVDGHRYGPFKTAPGLSVIRLNARGRTVRIDAVHSTGGNTGAQDIAIYGR
jgi:hypothetical protein